MRPNAYWTTNYPIPRAWRWTANKRDMHWRLSFLNGNAVTIVPVQAEFTTQQAADFLNVSRPFLIELLEARALPHRKVGSHRRVRFEDLLHYRQTDDAKRQTVFDQVAARAQELGLGYRHAWRSLSSTTRATVGVESGWCRCACGFPWSPRA